MTNNRIKMTDNQSLDEKLRRVYENPSDKRQLFDDWAATYDKDLISDFGYVAHRLASEKLIELVPDRQARIIDIGCGTGLVGKYLADCGYQQIDGNDYSSQMLLKAEELAVYNSLKEHDITKPMAPVEAYDASIAVGLFAFSVPAAEHLVNVVNCVKRGGPAIVTVNGKAWVERDWPKQLDHFQNDNPNIKIESVDNMDYLTAQGIDGRLLVLRRPGV